MNTTDTFKVALDKFVAEAQAVIDEHMAKNFPTLPRETLSLDPGRKYVRIWKSGPGSGRSAFCFIDSTNGDVLKPDTWKKPAKHARGNVYVGKASDAVGPYGAHYLA
jgi:hypothetical protein